jgi:pimeloyl-ACP methyl ester carboxylesterase
VDVPLDRTHPGAGTIPIYFELYPHSDTSRRPISTIVPSVGGPGTSNTRSIVRDFWRGFFATMLPRHDLLLIDHRGSGNSSAIDCPALQHGVGEFLAAIRACGALLGASADRYGSGDIAEDIDAVRAALGIQEIDYFSVSYGAVDARAYAFRHPDHLRSAIIDSPFTSGDDSFGRAAIRFEASVVSTICVRSPGCSAANPDPASELAWLARDLRRHPFDGVGFDADGVSHTLHVDEATLFTLLGSELFSPSPQFLSQGELTAAATALQHGDSAPLLRLVAENPVSLDAGDPAGIFSVGATFATVCADGRFPWDKNASEATRRMQFDAAFAALSSDSYAPFSAAAVKTASDRYFDPFGPSIDACVAWPAPTRPEPPYPTNQPFSNTPALILGGDLEHLALGDTRTLAALFPRGHFIEVKNAGHPTGWWSACSQAIEFHFIDSLQLGDTSCAADLNSPFHGIFDPPTNFVPYAGVGRFPSLAHDALPAPVDPVGTNRTTLSDRRVASVAWGAVQDAFFHAGRMSGTSGRGLRGGNYTVTTSDTSTTIDYRGARFSNDISVTGQASLDLTTNTVDAQVSIEQVGEQSGDQLRRAGHLVGTLTFHGTFFTPRSPNGHVGGVIGGRRVALLVPMN